VEQQAAPGVLFVVANTVFVTDGFGTQIRRHAMGPEQKHVHDEGDPGTVKVHIDKKPYQSPNSTTGAALYELGQVKSGLVLYRDARGDREDTPVENDHERIHLHEGDHFHSDKPRGVAIIVEGTLHRWPQRTITYEQVVTLFDPDFPQHPEITYSVMYDHGPPQNPEGTLSPGGYVRIKNRMVFHVSRTGQS